MKTNRFGFINKIFCPLKQFSDKCSILRELLEYFVFGSAVNAASETLQCSVSWESGAFTTD